MQGGVTIVPIVTKPRGTRVLAVLSHIIRDVGHESLFKGIDQIRVKVSG